MGVSCGSYGSYGAVSCWYGKTQRKREEACLLNKTMNYRELMRRTRLWNQGDNPEESFDAEDVGDKEANEVFIIFVRPS